MLLITSKENDLIKHIKKLKSKKYRDEYNEYIIEGAKIVKEAIEEKSYIKQIILNEEFVNSELIEKNLKQYLKTMNFVTVSNNVFKSISDVEKPQGVIAIIGKNRNNSKIDFLQDIILVLDGIQDPGNLGTIIRTADSIGLKQIIVSKETTDHYSSKVIRSTMGAIFRVNIIESQNLVDSLKEIQKNNYKIITTSLQTNKSIYDIKLRNIAIVIGNEANGVSKEILDIADEKVIIPMLGKTESLNASVATGVILYEYVRQKLNN